MPSTTPHPTPEKQLQNMPENMRPSMRLLPTTSLFFLIVGSTNMYLHVSTYGWEVLICRTLKSFKLWGVPSLGPLHCRGFPSMGVLKMHAL
jgi:hypothetical protein